MCRCVDMFKTYRHGIDTDSPVAMSMCRYFRDPCRYRHASTCRCVDKVGQETEAVSISTRMCFVSMCRYTQGESESSVDVSTCRCVDIHTVSRRAVSIKSVDIDTTSVDIDTHPTKPTSFHGSKTLAIFYPILGDRW